MIEKNDSSYLFVSLDFLNKDFLLPENPTEEDENCILEDMGFFREENDNNKARFKFLPNVFSTYLGKTALFVRDESDNLFIYNYKGFYVEAEDWVMGIICKKLMNQVCDLWSAIYERQGLESLRRDITAIVPQFNSTDSINLINGMLDVDSMDLLAHSPRFYSTIQLDISYNKTATCTRFIKFIDEITDEDKELATVLQEVVGYCLCHNVKADRAFFFYGNGKNGKSVLARVIEQLVGEKNVSHVMLSSLNDNFALAAMMSKNVNISPESDLKGKLATNTFKAIVSGDTLTVSRKYKNSLHLSLSCKLIFLINTLPSTTDLSHGFFRRLMVLPFSRTFEVDEDKSLADKLQMELPGILNWALVGLKRLQQNGYQFSTSKAIADALLAYKNQQNPLSEFFFDYYEQSDKGLLLQSSIYLDYCRWAEANGIESVTLSQCWEMLHKKEAEPDSEIRLEQKKIKGVRFIVGYQRRKDVPPSNPTFSLNGEEL